MALAPLATMTFGEIEDYVEALEAENVGLRMKTDNKKKLSTPEVRRMRLLYDSGSWTQAELAYAFMLNPGTVSRIVRGEYHKEV